MAEELKGRMVGGDGKVAEVDGGYFGGYVKPANYRENRRDRRLARNQNGKRKVVVVVRERDGNSLPAVFQSEAKAIVISSASRSPRARSSTPTKPASWDDLHERFEVKRINHQEAYSARRRLHELGRGIFQPHAPRRDRAPSPYRGRLFAPLRARSVMARR